ncbi:guanine nucleotide-binding protein subunit gamma [Trichonephila inaurata madagascariensis]|uniref:Guanine nucleotide-binding protein subunit gamma n=1 Tax=Trichonephila inaurata madagascariensis TaxID=2747483 RepID=A0A8X6XY82_9ARAC|nr:guanine nucleotide-binding protein subunit gamma [Trichonephila inaurata madagascariensis]
MVIPNEGVDIFFLPSVKERLKRMSSIQQRRKVVEQLRREASIKRINVSVAVEDLKKYVQEHESEDYILVGFHSQKANPFREKNSCSIL